MEYLDRLEQVLNNLEKITCDLIFFQAGVDVLDIDSLGHLSLSRDGIKQRNKLILEFVKKKAKPLVVFMGGGYARPIEASVNSFVDLFEECSRYA